MSSAGQLVDRSYLIRVGPPSAAPWWSQLECAKTDAESEANERSNSCDETATGCIYVDSVDLRMKARYMNDCLSEAGYNVTFVPDCIGEYARVVALRNITAGEEIFVSYGRQYWEASSVSGTKHVT
eukprot:CAMPEP_0171747594 /NCGR_PEP_ID=MMETSP0991-20121206/39557_1 /TAXON_ID=483369 /ORGANISM="non described non described, Strain CCMP2098" /LENGTH=125 /DNA_ID=CAMNT_0012347703 /DNA_START=10 /DNA_END=387 /DNA_ORIENTATION=+